MHDQQPVRVLVYGSTGSQARPLVEELLRRGHHPVVLTRNATKAAPLAALGATIAEHAPTDHTNLITLSATVDVVALMIPFGLANPADVLAYGKNAIDAAQAAGVQLIVWNTSGPFQPEAVTPATTDPRQHIAAHLQASGIPHIIFAPTIYAENLLGPWTAPAVATTDEVPYATPPAMRVGWLASADLAALMVAAIERPELAGQIFMVSGIEALSGPELAAAFSEALGRPFTYRGIPPDAFGAILDQTFGPGAGAGATAIYGPLWALETPPTLAFDMQPVLAALPVRMRTMREWVREHAAAFQPPTAPSTT
jgi:uncharacterized protein YbjT (DUF2867 family)